MNVVCCQVEVSAQAFLPSRESFQVWCDNFVWFQNLKNEVTETWVELLHHKENIFNVTENSYPDLTLCEPRF